MKRWKQRPEGSTWGDWGDDDQLGRLNLITPQKVLEGIAEVKEGLSFCLSLPLDFPGGNVLNPRRLPPVLSPTGDENGWRFNFHTKTINPLFMDVASDDRVILTLQYSTQWDTLAHVGGLFDADGDGVIDTEVEIPGELEPGDHHLASYGLTSGVGFSQSFTIDADDGAALPATGSDSTRLLLVGGAFALLGSAVVAIAARRRQDLAKRRSQS